MRDQHNSSINGEGKTSAVRPRKQPYNPRSGSSKADRQAPAMEWTLPIHTPIMGISGRHVNTYQGERRCS